MCSKGYDFGLSEINCPMRMLTTTVKISGAEFTRLPVISSGEIPKARLIDCLKILYDIEVSGPVKCNEVIVHDILGLGVDIIASVSLA